MTTTKILATLLILVGLVCIALIISLSKQKSKRNTLLERIRPYEHWDHFSDGTYAIPLNCKLYTRDQSGYRSVGTVAQNFEEFSGMNYEEVLEEYFYGNQLDRDYIPVKIVSVDINSNAVGICSITGKRFTILRKDNENFPRVIKVNLEREENS